MASPITPSILRNNTCSKRLNRKSSADLPENTSATNVFNNKDEHQMLSTQNSYKALDRTNTLHSGRKDNIPCLMQKNLNFCSHEDPVSDLPSTVVKADVTSKSSRHCISGQGCSRKSKDEVLNTTRGTSNNSFDTQSDLCPSTNTSLKARKYALSNKLPHADSEILPLDLLRTKPQKTKCLAMPSTESYVQVKEISNVPSQNVSNVPDRESILNICLIIKRIQFLINLTLCQIATF